MVIVASGPFPATAQQPEAVDVDSARSAAKRSRPMRFIGIARSEEFQEVTRAHIVVW